MSNQEFIDEYQKKIESLKKQQPFWEITGYISIIGFIIAIIFTMSLWSFLFFIPLIGSFIITLIISQRIIHLCQLSINILDDQIRTAIIDHLKKIR